MKLVISENKMKKQTGDSLLGFYFTVYVYLLS